MLKRAALQFSDFVEFAQLITGMVNRKKIIWNKNISRKTLSGKFKPFFDHPLTAEEVWKIAPPTITKNKGPWIYGVDGKWLKREGVILIHRDVTHKENLFWSFHKSESYQALFEDLTKLSRLISESSGNFPIGAISDWKMAIVTAVASHFGPIPHQRCLSHVLRLAKRLLPEHSPIEATLKLREIAMAIKEIKNHQEKDKWQNDLKQWEIQYGHLLKEKTPGTFDTKKKWWYTHGSLRRGYRLLTYDWEPLFVYLDNNLIPKSNNSLEGINSQLDQKLGSHRGMKINQQTSFVFWYLTFGDGGNNLPKLRKLWAYWRKSFLN